jgi:hypothetical protein
VNEKPHYAYSPELEDHTGHLGRRYLLGGRYSSSLSQGCGDPVCPVCSSTVDDVLYEGDAVREYSVNHRLRNV